MYVDRNLVPSSRICLLDSLFVSNEGYIYMGIQYFVHNAKFSFPVNYFLKFWIKCKI